MLHVQSTFFRLYYRIWPAKASKGFRFSLTYFKDYLHHHWASTVHRKRTTPKGWMYILVNPCNLPGRYHCAFGGFCVDETKNRVRACAKVAQNVCRHFFSRYKLFPSRYSVASGASIFLIHVRCQQKHSFNGGKPCESETAGW